MLSFGAKIWPPSTMILETTLGRERARVEAKTSLAMLTTVAADSLSPLGTCGFNYGFPESFERIVRHAGDPLGQNWCRAEL